MIKVFLDQAHVVGYQVDPPDTFAIQIGYTIFMDDGNKQIGSMDLVFAKGTTPYEVYAKIYQNILDACDAIHTEVPTKNDIFGYVPTPFSVILPDLPSFT